MDKKTHIINSIALVFISTAIFFKTLNSQPSPQALLPYLGVFIFTYSIWRLIYIHTEKYRKFFKICALTCALFSVVMFGKIDTYQRTWQPDDKTTIIDTRTRWGNLITYRIFKTPTLTAHGPIKNTDGEIKLHGRWITYQNNNSTVEYYWYHEQISEGDWHLRQK